MFTTSKVIAVTSAIVGAAGLAGASDARALNVGPGSSGAMPLGASGPSARIVINSAISLNCANSGFNGSFGTGLNPTPVATIQPLFTNAGSPDCIGPSGFQVSVTCVSASTFVVTGAPVGGPTAVTPGQLANISCVVAFTLISCSATMSGSVPASYTNPIGADAGRLTVSVAGQALTVNGSTCPVSVLPNGTARFGGTGAGALGLVNLPYTLTGAATTHPFMS